MADGSIVIQTDIDDKKAQAELNRLAKKIDDLNAKIKQAETDRLPWLEQAEQLGVKLDEAKAKLEAMRTAPAGTYTAEQIAEQAETVKSLQAQWDAAQKKVEGYDRAIERARSQLGAAEERAGELAEQLSTVGDAGERAGGQISAAMEQAQKRLEKFEKRVIGLAKRVFVFTLISKALRSLKDYLWENIQTSAEAQAAIAKLRGALLTLAQPLVNVIIPAFTKLVELLAKVAATAAKVVSKLFGQTVETTAAQAEESYNARNALKDESKALKDTAKAAKEAEKQLADFDEIQKLTSDTAEDNADLLGADTGLDTAGTAPDFKSVIGNQLDAIIELFAGAALLALGAILTFSGANIPLGIALMVIGALAVWDAISENWDAVRDALQGPLGAIFALVSSALLVIGAILTFSGANIPLGLGLMIVGAAGLAAEAAANWDTITDALQGPIGAILAIISGALLVIGAVLTFSGANIPLGIGLMVLGVAGMASEIAANWDTITAALGGTMDAIRTIVSGALLVLGAVLTFTGASIPLGIGLLVLGAAGLASELAENWDSITEALGGTFEAIHTFVSGALLVLGIILVMTGAALPLGLGLIVAGAVGLAAEIAEQWDLIPQQLQGKIDAILTIVSAALLVLGVILVFTGAGIPLGLGMIAAGAAGLAAAKEPDWEWLASKLQEVWDKITEAAKTAWEAIQQFFSDTWDKIKDIFDKAVEKIKKTLSDTWDKVKDGAKQAWDGVKETISGIIDKIVEKVEGFKDKVLSIVESVKSALSSVGNAVSGAFSKVGNLFGGGGGTTIGVSGFSNSSGTFGISSASIPGLARGAVIPPNREFLAVLGDQRSGNNIEAPESALQAMADRAASANTELLREILRAVQAGKVLRVGEYEFGSLIHDSYDAENSRIGDRFVKVT